MKKLLAITFLLLATTSYAQNISAEYKVIQSKKYGKKIDVLFKGKLIHEIFPKHQEEIGEGSLVILAYNDLIRGGHFLKEQPKLFDDVTGDGNPNIIVLERPARFSNASLHLMAVRIFSISDGKIEESEPIIDGIGEMLHFDDFNGDGILELVNTDGERYFLYSRDGFPISNWVWIYDSYYKSYYKAARMVK